MIIHNFFKNTNANTRFIFWTYSFDEEVLVKILQDNNVSNDVTISVFHEIMRHRGNGILKSYFKNSRTIAVRLKCKQLALFHPKIWFRYDGGTCTKVLVGSFNLARYHFEKRKNPIVFDSIFEIESPCLQKDLKKMLEFKKSKACWDPFTIVITKRNNKFDIGTTDKSAFSVIQDNVNGGAPSFSYSPFFSKTALRMIYDTDDLNKVNHCYKLQKNKELHAKGILYPGINISGSFNLTIQGCLGNEHEEYYKAQNVEVVLVLKMKSVHKWKMLKRNQIPKGEDKEYESEESDGDYSKDWVLQKENAIKAPSVKLIFDKKFKLKLSKPEKVVTIYSPAVASYEINPNTCVDQEKLIQTLKRWPVMIRGKNWGPVELDFNGYREVFSVLFEQDLKHEAQKVKHKKRNRGIRYAARATRLFFDIRILRKHMLSKKRFKIKDSEVKKIIDHILKSENKHQFSLLEFPVWLQSLHKKFGES